MILLTLIAVGLLSLSAVSLRSSSQQNAQAEARANARLALMLALGDLQKQLGPDRRISAKAEILDTDPTNEKADAVANPHYLGVWNSWDAWLTDKKGTLTIQNTYKRGRDSSLFRAWLVSDPDSEKYDTAINGTPAADWIELCGKNSAGADTANHVKVRPISLKNGSQVAGNYAWWVSDESQKARINNGARRDPADINDAQLVATHTGRYGVEAMEGMSDFDTRGESMPKMVTSGGAAIGEPDARRHFHNITAYSLGLLTDVRSGGFKSDLNLAFESDTLPTHMDQATLFGTRSFDAPVRPMVGELSKISPKNPYVAPMSWRQMREFYRLYRTFGNAPYKQPVGWSNGAPSTRRILMGKAKSSSSNKWEERDTAGYARDLVLLRETWIIATKAEINPAMPGGISYLILGIPIVYLWNPYDVAMKVDSAELSCLGGMYWSFCMFQKTYRGSTLLSDTRFPDEDQTHWPNGNKKPNNNITANQLGYRMIPVNQGGNGTIIFEPGQVRVFSTDSEITHGIRQLSDANAMASRHFFASPGYTPVQNSPSGVLRGLKYHVSPGPLGVPSGPGALSLSLRIAATNGQNDNFYYGNAPQAFTTWRMHEVFAAKNGAIYENGTIVDKQGAGEWQDVAYMSGISLNWLAPTELSDAWVVRDEQANRAQWGAPGSPPMPVAIVSIVAKTPELLEFESSQPYAKDYRNRSWLHAPATGLGQILMNPQDLNRAASAYQIHFRPVNGDQEVAEYLQANGPEGYFGGGYTPAEGQSHVTSLSLPAAPIVNLASFSGIRMDHARARFTSQQRYENIKHLSHVGAAFGVGIGNGYAHPMIDPRGVYTRHDFGADTGFNGSQATNIPICDDHWDHLFLANEELWDSWFCSGIVPTVRAGQVITAKKTVAEDFFSSKTSPVASHYQPELRGKTAADLSKIVETTNAAVGMNGWDLIASYLLNQGQFNVNSTSKEAWKALLMGLSDRPLALNDPTKGISVMARDLQQATISRHLLANGDGDAAGPDDENAWRGIRKLTSTQIDKLAEQIVRQVKLRGPFLNMTEFINRRLSDDELGVSGTLQAAIDWDEFDAKYDGTLSGAGDSINKAYKKADAMIMASSQPAKNYPNPKAGSGSHFAGIPGYVMQSDILQGMSNSLSVRGDTFVIRTYGDSRLKNGTVAAKAWCEAVVQRMPEFVDSSDAAEKKMRDPSKLPGDTVSLSPINQIYGRKFQIVGFRWLNENEI